MKEDEQLTCPISFEDPDGVWVTFEKVLKEKLPLREVSWKSPFSSSFITVPQLPLRFMPANSSLFKDTEHSFRWFLCSYVNLYFLVAESLDAYKYIKPNVKKWIEQQNQQKGSLGKIPWLVVYFAMGHNSIETYNKIYYRISGDFYAERSGDRTVMMYMPPTASLHYSSVNQQINTSWNEFLTKLKEGIVTSFQNRNSLYDIDIRRLEQTRNTQMFDFKKLFLVRESLALLYQMMQLNDQSLQQYEELDNLLDSLPSHNLPENEWPMILPEPLKSEATSGTSTKSEAPALDSTPPPSGLSGSKKENRDCMSDAVKNGDEITVYSINLARMKILKNRLSFIELKKYLLSRQLYFLILLKRPVQYAEKSLKFLKDSIQTIQQKYPLFSYDYLSEECNDSVILPNKEFLLSLLRMKQMEIWALTSSIKLLRVCRDLIYKIFEFENHNHDYVSSSGSTLQRTFTQAVSSLMSLDRSDGLNNKSNYSRSYTFAEQESIQNSNILNTVSTSNSTAGNNNNNNLINNNNADSNELYVYKDAFIACNELLDFAMQRFTRLCSTIKYAKKYGELVSMNIVKNHLALFSKPNAITQVTTSLSNISVASSQQETTTSSSSDEKKDPNSSDVNSNYLKAKEYFSHFSEEGKFSSAAELLQKDLLDSKFLEDNNLETALASIMGRVRTASHFWAKIYAIDESAFGLDIRHTEEFIFSQYSNFSKSQLEKGKILEITIALTLYKCFHELNIICQRNRLAVMSKFKIVQLLSCAEQHTLLLPYIRHLLGQNSNANLLLQSPPLMMKDMTMSNLKYEISNQLRLWLFQLYLNSAAKLNNIIEYRQGLSWLTLNELYHPHNPIKTLFSVRSPTNLSDSMISRTALSSPNSFSWFRELLKYTELYVNQFEKPLFIEGKNIFQLKSFRFHPTQVTTASNTTTPADSNHHKNQASSIPASSSTSANNHTILQNSRSYIKGFQLINEERYPANALQYICDEKPFYLMINIHSQLSFPVKVKKILLIYKKIHSESFKNNFGMLYNIPSEDNNGGTSNNSNNNINNNNLAGSYPNIGSPISPKSFSSNFLRDEKDVLTNSLGKDEFPLFLSEENYVSSSAYRSRRSTTVGSLDSQLNSNLNDNEDDQSMNSSFPTEGIVLFPGDQELLFEFFPTSLGEYALDRYYFILDSLIMYNYPILNDLQLIPSQADVAISYRDQPLTPEVVQTYFNTFPLLRIIDPEITLNPSIQSSLVSPFLQKDYCILKLDILPFDYIEELILFFPSVDFMECIHRYTGDILDQQNFYHPSLSSEDGTPNSPYRNSMSQSHSGGAGGPGNNNTIGEGADILSQNSLAMNNNLAAIQALTRGISNTTGSNLNGTNNGNGNGNSNHFREMNNNNNNNSTFYPSSNRKPSMSHRYNRSRGTSLVEEAHQHMNKIKFTLQILSFQDWKCYRIDAATGEKEVLTPLIETSSSTLPSGTPTPSLHGGQASSGLGSGNGIGGGGGAVHFNQNASNNYSSSIRLTNIKGNGSIVLCIPFIPFLLINSKNAFISSINDLFYRVILNYHFQISLKRKLCKIPLQILSQKTLLLGEILTGKLFLNSCLTQNHQSMIIAQLELMNLYDYPIRLIGYQVSNDEGHHHDHQHTADFKMLMTNGLSSPHFDSPLYDEDDQDDDNSDEKEMEELPVIRDNAHLLQIQQELLQYSRARRNKREDEEASEEKQSSSPAKRNKKRPAGIVIEKTESYFLNFTGTVKSNEMKFKISFYFMRLDAVSSEEIFQDLVFTYDTWLNLETCANKHNPIRLDLKEFPPSSAASLPPAPPAAPAPVAVKGPRIDLPASSEHKDERLSTLSPSQCLGQLGKVLLIEGIFSLNFEAHVPKFIIRSVNSPGESKSSESTSSITSLSKTLAISPEQHHCYRSVTITVGRAYPWLAAGLTVLSTSYSPNSKDFSAKIQLKGVPLIVGKIPFPNLEVNLLDCEKNQRKEVKVSISDELVGEMQIHCIPPPSGKKFSPLLVFEES